MDVIAIVTIFAIIAGPVLAVQVQKLIERIRQKREEQRNVFMTLMATRGRPLVPDHVNALNMIDVVFSDKGSATRIFFLKHKKDRAVVEAWAAFNDHLNHYPQQPPVLPNRQLPDAEQATYRTRCDTWESERYETFIDLLGKMAESLGYHFDKVLLKRGAYTPKGYGDAELSQQVIQRGLTEVFLGMKSIPIQIVQPMPPEATESGRGDATPEIPPPERNRPNLLQ